MVRAAARRLVRLPLLVALLFAGLATVLLGFPFSSADFRRAAIRTWSRLLCAACGLRIIASTAPGAHALSRLPQGRLLLANHVSWLDIFAIDALCPASFVAKSEIASWPLVGTLVARAGTLFIERGRRHAVHRMIEHVDMHLRNGGRVAVFPEGTTGDGRALLPFHANLIQAAIVAQAPVVPVGLRYRTRDGAHASSIEFIGDTTFVASVWRILGAPAVTCEVISLPEIPTTGGITRHEVAERVRCVLAEALGLPLEETSAKRIPALRREDR